MRGVSRGVQRVSRGLSRGFGAVLTLATTVCRGAHSGHASLVARRGAVRTRATVIRNMNRVVSRAYVLWAFTIGCATRNDAAGPCVRLARRRERRQRQQLAHSRAGSTRVNTQGAPTSSWRRLGDARLVEAPVATTARLAGEKVLLQSLSAGPTLFATQRRAPRRTSRRRTAASTRRAASAPAEPCVVSSHCSAARAAPARS